MDVSVPADPAMLRQEPYEPSERVILRGVRAEAPRITAEGHYGLASASSAVSGRGSAAWTWHWTAVAQCWRLCAHARMTVRRSA